MVCMCRVQRQGQGGPLEVLGDWAFADAESAAHGVRRDIGGMITGGNGGSSRLSPGGVGW